MSDLAGTSPNAATVYTDLLEAGTGSPTTFVGSDHYPIFGDYTVASLVPVLVAPVAGLNPLQFTVADVTGNNYAVEVSTNLSAPVWVAILTNQTPFTFKDTNDLPRRFYRARQVP